MTSELDRFKTILATIALREPELSLAKALLIADELETQMRELPLASVAPWTPDWKSTPQVARWVKEQPVMREMHAEGRSKIDMIKKIREISELGLKEAKDAYEAAYPERGIPPF